MKAKLTTRTIEQLKPEAQRYEVRDTEIPGFLLRVSPSGAMAFFCDFRRPDGRRTRVRLGDAAVLGPARARDEALKVLGDLARGQDPAANRKAAQMDTLDAFIRKHYQPWAESHRKTGAKTVSQALKCFEDFKQSRLSEISPWRVEKWRSARLKGGVKPSTVNRNITMLKAIIEKSVEWEILPANPLARVRPLKTDLSAKVRYLDPHEESAIRIALNDREQGLREARARYNEWLFQRGLPEYPDLREYAFADHLKPMVLVSINTGVRRGELFSLRWEDVDFERPAITIAGESAKSGKTRHVPLNREAAQTLTAWRSQSEGDGLVFPNFKGIRFDNIQTSWSSVLKTAGIHNFRWHDLRHHFASRLVMAGVDLNTVRELLGHGDLKMTLRYAHLAPQIKAAAVAKLDIA